MKHPLSPACLAIALLCATAPNLSAAASSSGSAAPLAKGLAGKLVTVSKGEKRGSGKITPYDDTALEGLKYIAIYFSAGWCPPCHRFTPSLVKDYPKLKALNPNFELVFASNDKNENEMLSYMLEFKMPWPAVEFDKRRLAPLGRYKARGIPNLVFIEAATGNVISASYKGNEYIGPDSVLRDIWKTLKKEASAK